jgi:NADH-quinone oxidoreductase subunit L
MNRIADVFFILGILLLFIEFKSLNYFIIFSLLDFIDKISYYIIFTSFTFIDSVVIFLCLGAIGKSAQLGLHT